MSYDAYDEGVYCRSRIWLLMAYALSLGAIAGSVLVMLHRGGEVSSILQVSSGSFRCSKRIHSWGWRSWAGGGGGEVSSQHAAGGAEGRRAPQVDTCLLLSFTWGLGSSLRTGVQLQVGGGKRIPACSTAGCGVVQPDPPANPRLHSLPAPTCVAGGMYPGCCTCALHLEVRG